MSSAKENNAAVGNTPTKSTMLKNAQLDRVARCSLGPPNKACSPVREEDDEQFSSGDCAIQKLTRDHDRARKAEIEHQRRQSYAAGARRKVSLCFSVFSFFFVFSYFLNAQRGADLFFPYVS